MSLTDGHEAKPEELHSYRGLANLATDAMFALLTGLLENPGQKSSGKRVFKFMGRSYAIELTALD